MSGNTNNSPMLKAAGLWSKTSVKGGQYLTGRLGGVKVLVMENRDRKSDDDPSHHLFFVEAPDRRQGVQDRPQERSEGAGYTKRLRGHHSLTVAASLGIGTGSPTITRRSTTIFRMRRSGRNDGGEFSASRKRAGRKLPYKFPDLKTRCLPRVFPQLKTRRLRAFRARVLKATGTQLNGTECRC
jgi:hypothetical protein